MTVLSALKVGETAVLVSLDLPESVQNHLMHMGFVPDALVTALRRAPAGDPTVYRIDGMEIALRHETADAIQVRVGPVRVQARDDARQDAREEQNQPTHAGAANQLHGRPALVRLAATPQVAEVTR